ncbi:MAG TPA: DUF805 domain-containing protein [Burkholderiales bacterium]
MEWYLAALKKYATFSGRARRSEYWYFVLFNTLIFIALAVVDMVVIRSKFDALGTIFNLATLLPSLAVFFRRLHDTGRSGWWWLIGLIPILGWIVLLIFLIKDSDPGDNRFGPNPKDA